MIVTIWKVGYNSLSLSYHKESTIRRKPKMRKHIVRMKPKTRKLIFRRKPKSSNPYRICILNCLSTVINTHLQGRERQLNTRDQIHMKLLNSDACNLEREEYSQN